jgi:hypothetical protein
MSTWLQRFGARRRQANDAAAPRVAPKAGAKIAHAATDAVVRGVETYGPFAVGMILITSAATLSVAVTAFVVLMFGGPTWAAGVAGLTGAGGAAAAVWKRLQPPT